MEYLEKILGIINTSTSADLRNAAERFSAECERTDNSTFFKVLFSCLAGICASQAEVAAEREKNFKKRK